MKAEFSALVEESVAYTVFLKCGLSTEWSEGSFENIRSYNSLPLFMALGNCTVSIARPILREVYQEIQNIKNERSKIYEDRAIDEPGIPTGQRRDDVLRTPDFDRRADRPDAGGEVREPVEGVHDGGASAPPLRTGGTGKDQRDDFAGGKGGGAAEGGADTATPGHAADAGDRGHDGTGGASRHDNEGSGGNRDKRSGAENQVIPQSVQDTQPPADGNKPSADGFFVVPPRTQGQAAGEHHALVDAVLCADDLTQDAAEWLKNIAGFYRENDNPELRAHVLRIFYRGMDRNYTTKDGEYSLRVMADEVKLTIREGGNSASYTYEELAEQVERLIRDGHYPFSDTEKRTEEENALFAREETRQKETKQADAGVENAGRENTDQENENREGPEPENADRKEIRGEDTDLKSTGRKRKEKKDGREGDNLPEENQAGRKQQGKYSPAGKIPGKEIRDGGQLSLFDLGIKDGYEDASGADGDAMLDRMAMSDGEAVPDNENVQEQPSSIVKQPSGEGFSGEKTAAITDGDLHGSATYPEERKTAQEEAENTQEVEREVDGQPMPILDIPAGQSSIQYPQAQPATNTQNYRFFESHHLYDGGPKTKCQNNIAAIRLLKELQAQSRMATAEEQITLAKFVGWGGLADALTPNKLGWENQYEEIKSLLTEEEFAAAQESTLTAYYTEQGIIRHIYDALEQFGFHGGSSHFC